MNIDQAVVINVVTMSSGITGSIKEAGYIIRKPRSSRRTYRKMVFLHSTDRYEQDEGCN